MYVNLQEILLKAANGHDYSNELQTVTDFYGDDFDPVQLHTQLQLLTQHFRSIRLDLKKLLPIFNLCQLHSVPCFPRLLS